MALFANAFPDDWTPGCDFIQIEDEEFTLVSEPAGGLIAVMPDNNQGYLTIAAAERLLTALTKAIENSKSMPPDMSEHFGQAGKEDDDIAF